MKKILVTVFFAAMVAVGCQLETVTDDDVSAVDVYTDTTDDSGMVEGVDVTTDTTLTVNCEPFFNYWQCFCQSGLCSGELWKTVVPCAQGNCAMVTDVTEVDGKTYQADCSDIGKIQDGVLVVSAGAGLEETIYICIPAPPP